MGNVLITGSAGMIGRILVEKESRNVLKFEKPMDIMDIEEFKILEKEDIEHVYHLAAKTYVPYSWDNPREFYQINTMGTLNVLEFCRKKNISLTYISSYIYGDSNGKKIDESYLVKPQNPYSHSKFLAEEMCRFYIDNYNLDITIIRPFNIYGYFQNENFLIPHIIKQVNENEIIRVKDLEPKRDYIFVDDVVEFLIKASYKKFNGIVNLGTGQSYSVKEIIDIIQSVYKTNKVVISENIIRKNEISNVISDIRKMKEVYEWQPKISLEKGIRLIKEYREKRGLNKWIYF